MASVADRYWSLKDLLGQAESPEDKAQLQAHLDELQHYDPTSDSENPEPATPPDSIEPSLHAGSRTVGESYSALHKLLPQTSPGPDRDRVQKSLQELQQYDPSSDSSSPSSRNTPPSAPEASGGARTVGQSYQSLKDLLNQAQDPEDKLKLQKSLLELQQYDPNSDSSSPEKLSPMPPYSIGPMPQPSGGGAGGPPSILGALAKMITGAKPGAGAAPTPKLPGAPPLPNITPKVLAAQGLPEEQGTDWVARMAAARQQGDRGRLGANLARAGAMISAAGARKPVDLSPYEQFDKEAAIPEQRVGQDMQFEQLAQAAKKAREADDPKSKENRLAQDAFIKTAPIVAKQLGGEIAVRSMTKAQLDGLFGMEDTRAERERKTGEDTEKARHDAEQEKIDWYKALHPPPAAGATQNRADQRGLEGLGKETSKFSDMVTGLDQIEQGMKGLSAKSSPLTIGQRALLALPGGTNFAKPEAVALQKARDDFMDLLIRARTGAVINNQEQEHYAKLFEDGITGNQAAAAEVLRQFRTKLRNKLRDTQIGYGVGPNPVLKQFEQGGGTTFNHPALQDGPPAAAQKPAAPAKAPPSGPDWVSGTSKKTGKRMWKNKVTGEVVTQ